MKKCCETLYPVVLVHGIGFRDRKHLNYWGRIPKILAEHGASVYYGNQDSHGSIESNALQIKTQIKKILEDTECRKVNIISHSKGGLDTRYLISCMDMRDYVASLTTISSPHHGSKTVDKLLSFPDFCVKIAAFCTNLWYRLLGDKNPDSYRLFHQISAKYASEYNEKVKDCEEVYYQSYAFVMNNIFSDIFLALTYIVIKICEGENDGIVPAESAKWTNFKGVIRSSSNRGISHCDEVDMRRHRLSKKEKEGCISDITNFYINIVSDLKERGF